MNNTEAETERNIEDIGCMDICSLEPRTAEGDVVYAFDPWGYVDPNPWAAFEDDKEDFSTREMHGWEHPAEPLQEDSILGVLC